MKRIPKKFQLGSHTFTVHLMPAEELEEKAGACCYGLFMPDDLSIWLAQPSKSLKRSVVLQAFYHELFHAIFWVAGHQWTNEKLVDQCGYLMSQVITTAEF